jgi:predicted outer membrane protein
MTNKEGMMRHASPLFAAACLTAALVSGMPAQGIPHPEIKLDDSFILGTRAAVDQEEITMARYAAAHADRADVRTFAASLLRGHRSAQGEASKLASDMHVELKITGDTSDAIMQRQRAADADMRHLKGAAFDREFLEAIRDEHTAEINKVTGWYASVAASDSVKSYLHEIMPTLVSHQQTADRLLRSTPRPAATH